MNNTTPFFVAPKAPAKPRDQWLLAVGGDGSMHVLHRWNYPETASRPYSGTGASQISLPDFFRNEASDTAKRRLRALLKENGQNSYA
jgi:hypothetical protein